MTKSMQPKQCSQFITLLKIYFKQKGFIPVMEHKFHMERKWRFDLAFIEEKVAVEYEGIFSKKSRHTTMTGYANDAEKYNAAASLGWTVLRYTAKNKTGAVQQIEALLMAKRQANNTHPNK